MIRLFPSRMMVTSRTSSGKATALGSLTACVLFDLNKVVSTMVPSLYIQYAYTKMVKVNI